MVETGHKDTGFPIEKLGQSQDTSTFNNLISWPDKNKAKFSNSCGLTIENYLLEMNTNRFSKHKKATPISSGNLWILLLLLNF